MIFMKISNSKTPELNCDILDLMSLFHSIDRKPDSSITVSHFTSLNYFDHVLFKKYISNIVMAFEMSNQYLRQNAYNRRLTMTT